jgi:hypothetical protein
MKALATLITILIGTLSSGIVVMYNLTKKYYWDWDKANDTIWNRLTESLPPVLLLLLITGAICIMINDSQNSA